MINCGICGFEIFPRDGDSYVRCGCCGSRIDFETVKVITKTTSLVDEIKEIGQASASNISGVTYDTISIDIAIKAIKEEIRLGHIARNNEVAEQDRIIALKSSLKKMIDLSEFWIERENREGMSNQQWKTWHALGYDSTAMREAKNLIYREIK